MSQEDTDPVSVEPVSERATLLANLLRGLGLVVLVLVVFLPAFSDGFIWSDDQLLTANPQVHSPDGWWTLWVHPQTADYFPLTSTTLWLEYHLGKPAVLWNNAYIESGTLSGWIDYHLGQFFRLWDIDFLQKNINSDIWGSPWNGYHIMNVLYHAIAVVLTWQMLKCLRIPGAWVAAAIFAVHPVCVESVAWITERENILAQIFLLLTIMAYVRFEETARLRPYLCAIICFTLALLAKTSGVMLPFILLLLTWWRRSRTVPSQSSDQLDENPNINLNSRGLFVRSEIIPLVPFFLIAALLGVVTIYFQYERAIAGDQIPIGNIWQRVANASFAIGFYLYSAFWPFNIYPIYPEWTRGFAQLVSHPVSQVRPPAPESVTYWLQIVPGLLIAGLLIFCWSRRAESWARALLSALGCYILGLLPVLGLLKMSFMRLTLLADHFQYISLIAVIAPVVAIATTRAHNSPPIFKCIWQSLLAAVLSVFCIVSWKQAEIHHSEKTFFTAVLENTPNSWQAHNQVGSALYMEGNWKAAYAQYLRAIELETEDPEGNNDLHMGLSILGRLDGVIHPHKTVIEENSQTDTNLANAYAQAKLYDDAIRTYRKALKMNPANASAHCNFGYVLLQEGRVDEAISEFILTVETDPQMPQGWADLLEALKLKGIDPDAPAPTGNYDFDLQKALELLRHRPQSK